MKTLPLMMVALVFAACASAPEVTQRTVTLEMLSPTGATEITELFTSRLADLNGKTVCEVNAGWEGHRTLPLVSELLQKQFPAVKIVPHTEFPGSRNDADHPKLMELVKKFKCDALIVGNAG